MNREVHVRFWEGVGVKFSRATQLMVCFGMDVRLRACIDSREVILGEWFAMYGGELMPLSCRDSRSGRFPLVLNRGWR